MVRRLLVLIATFCAIAPWAVVHAQQNQQTNLQAFDEQIGEERLKLGREVFDAAGSGRAYDEILPNVADNAKTTFIRSNPQMQLGVIEVVDKIALDMVARRQLFDDQLVRVWAAAFNADELRVIRDFYRTPAGKKFAALHPEVITTQLAVAEAWSQILAEEMLQRTTVELEKLVANEARSLQGDTEGTAPQANPQ